MKEVSIIIPAYNCEKTIPEAVSSVLKNGLKVSYEILITNDCSVDGTQNVIEGLQQTHGSEIIKIFTHKVNLGGGAARNTAIKNSTGRYIFMLDSDNLVEKGTIQKLYDFIELKKCDAACIHRRKWFSDSIKQVEEIDEFELNKKPLEIYTYFTKKDCAFVNNFHLYTRESYDISGGYPEHHGFDTQSFGLRWLSKGLIAYVCPDTAFYHRRKAQDKSYFEREYESGLLSENYYLVFEDILYLFSKDAQSFLLNYDTKNNISLESSIFKTLKETFDSEEKLFSNNYRQLLVKNITDLLDMNDPINKYWLGSRYFIQENFLLASQYFKDAICEGVKSVRAYYYIIKALENINQVKVVNNLYKFENSKTSGKVSLRESFLKRVIRKLLKVFGLKK